MAAPLAEVSVQKDVDLDVDDDDEDCFFESLGRVSSSVSFDVRGLGSSSSDSDADESRASFFSAVGAPSDLRCRFSFASSPFPPSPSSTDLPRDEDYGVWMEAPFSIQERRRRLLQGMGLNSTQKFGPSVESNAEIQAPQPPPDRDLIPSPRTISRSKSDAGGDSRAIRSEQLLGLSFGSGSLVRSRSMPPSFPFGGKKSDGEVLCLWKARGERDAGQANGEDKSKVCTIRDLDTGKEFVIDEPLEDGSWNRLCDPQTGMRLTLEEFEKSLGYSPIVRELMRRANIVPLSASSATAIRRNSKATGKKKRIGWLKNIRDVASTVTALVLEKEKELGSSLRYMSQPSISSSADSSSSSSSERMKVRQSRKPFKELTGLYLCQEIKAHQGSIWTIKFSVDGQFLASAGEDRIIHVWQVIDCDDHASSSWSVSGDDLSSRLGCSPDQSMSLEVRESQRFTTRILSHRKRSSAPRNIIPGTVFSLSQKPVCSFQGHLDDILDVSWSKSQHLLSSSMDKTVRLWDMERKACIKMFAHNDYVTCIQFNPVDDRFFISGSLDAKVRIWNIPDRHVVDWTDLPEMVTAACYTPDGQGAFVGSHKGTCRYYSTPGGKLHQKAQIEIQDTKRKSHAKKITGFQFVPGNPSEVLITSADSQIRAFDGVQLTQKFRGFRNTSSQMAASCTADANYVICASEDSNVYVWKRDELPRNPGKGKTWVTTRSYENFHCKDVSVAIPWPPSSCTKIESPLVASWLRHQSPLRSPPCHLQKLSPGATSSSNDDIFSGNNCPPNSKASFHSDSGLSDSGQSESACSSTFPSPSATTSRCINCKSTGMIQTSSAWGLVVVTAGLGGEIRIFQNFGLPRLLTRQNNLF